MLLLCEEPATGPYALSLRNVTPTDIYSAHYTSWINFATATQYNLHRELCRRRRVLSSLECAGRMGRCTPSYARNGHLFAPLVLNENIYSDQLSSIPLQSSGRVDVFTLIIFVFPNGCQQSLGGSLPLRVSTMTTSIECSSARVWTIFPIIITSALRFGSGKSCAQLRFSVAFVHADKSSRTAVIPNSCLKA